MGLRDFAKDKIEALILGNLAAGMASGQYGKLVQAVYLKTKGYVTWVSGAIALFALFAAQTDNTGASMLIAQASGALAGLGLVRKGAHLRPPEIPPAMRDALRIGGSILTWLLLTAEAVVYLCSQIGASWACGISDQAQLATGVFTVVAGFLATYASDPPAVPQEQETTNAR